MENNSSNSEILIKFLLETPIEKIPSSILYVSKKNILDNTAALISGSLSPVHEITKKYAISQMKGDDGVVLVTGEIISASGSVLVNGFSCNAFDIDDMSMPNKGHVGACLLPALLAAAYKASREGNKITGKEFLRIYSICHEISERAGIARHMISPKYHSSGSWGAISTGLGCAYLMGERNLEVLKNVMGAAEGHAPFSLMLKCTQNPCNIKDILGWGSFVGFSNACLGMLGFTGVPPIFDEITEDFKNDHPNRDISSEKYQNKHFLINTIGKEWLIEITAYKQNAGCYWTQGAVEAVQKCLVEVKKYLTEKNSNENPNSQLILSKIKLIKIETFKDGLTLLQKYPKNYEEAQYNYKYQIACAVLYDKVGPKELLNYANQPEILDVFNKIELKEDPESTKLYPMRHVNNAFIELYDGNIVSSGKIDFKWCGKSKEFVPSWEDLVEKYNWLVKDIIGDKNCDALKNLISNIEKEEDFIEKYYSFCKTDK